MLEKLLKLYVMAMAGDIRSPTPHLFGPPGCGKSTVAGQLADLVGKKLHVINVSRISPLELEGVQMPVDDNSRLHLLTATFWTQLEEGDILLFDEFLRGFPEVYNGLLDIFTARQVGQFTLPKVFIMAASNTTVSYDKALEDRLMHLPVADPRSSVRESNRLASLLVETIGLMPEMAKSAEAHQLMDAEIKPMFEMLDLLDHKASVGSISVEGHSLRNLIGQAQLREVQSSSLQELIEFNNRRAIGDGKMQYVVLLSGKNVDPRYVAAVEKLSQAKKLTELQRRNLELNLQLIGMEEARTETEEPDDEPELFA